MVRAGGMIEQTTLDDRPVWLVYLDNALNPVDKGQETLVKVVYRDTGETLWLVPKPAAREELPKEKINE
jgi:hypothetical protein